MTLDQDAGANDPLVTNADLYHLLWENGDVRVLEYNDLPGQETRPHTHPNTVLIALTDFDRRLSVGATVRDVSLSAGSAQWLPAQWHSGRNTGTTPTRTILVELKNSGHPAADVGDLGPAVPTSDPAVG